MKLPWWLVISMTSASMLALFLTPYVCIQVEDARRMKVIRETFPTVRPGDSKETVRQKLGPPVKVFPPTKGFLADPNERWVYGRTYQRLPNWDPFRAGLTGFGLNRVRFMVADDDDYVVTFGTAGRVRKLRVPLVTND